jgi:hypothetical protein
MSGVKAMIDALNVIYEQKESRSFIKLNLVALVFTLTGFAAFLLAIAAVVVLPLILSSVGLGGLTQSRRLSCLGMSASPPTPDMWLRSSEPTLRAKLGHRTAIGSA